MANPAKPPRPSLIETIEQLKKYTEFESVTVGADGSVSVKYAARVAAPEKKEPEKKKADLPRSAVNAIMQPPPFFKFES